MRGALRGLKAYAAGYEVELEKGVGRQVVELIVSHQSASAIEGGEGRRI